MNPRQTKCLSVLVWRVQGPDHAGKPSSRPDHAGHQGFGP